MKQQIKSLLSRLGLILILSFSLVPAFQATVYAKCNAGTGGIGSYIMPTWYTYLDSEVDGKGKCRPKLDGEVSVTATKIGIAVVEILVRVAGFVALGFLIWGGIQFIVSQGEPEGLSSAKNTIANSLIGLVISILTIGLIQFIGNSTTSTANIAGLPNSSVSNNFANYVQIVGSIAILLSIAFTAYGGFKYVTSVGDPTGVQKAKNTIVYALIGLAVTLSAYAIISFVTSRVA